MLIRRTAAAVLVTGLCLGGVTGCASPGTKVPASEASSSASTAPPASATPDALLTKVTFTQSVADAGYAAGTYHIDMAMKVSGADATISADVDASGQADGVTPKMSMTVTSNGQDFEMLLVDDMAYVNMAELTEGKFIAIDPKDSSSPFAAAFAGVAKQGDPLKSVAAMKNSLIDLKAVGEPSEVNGVLVQEYEATIKTPEAGDALTDQLGKAAEDLPDTMTAHYWLDKNNRPVKITNEVRDVMTEMTFSKWGDPVTITAPSADEIIEKDIFGTS